MTRCPDDSPIVTVAQMRAIEDAAFASGASQDELMECAGVAVARQAHRFGAAQRVLVLAGPGNNGGDAYVAARYLARWGHDVSVAALGQPRRGAAARMAAAWAGETIALADARAPDRPYVLIDGLFGIGVQRPLQLDPARRALFTDAQVRIAIDVPSGVESDAGATTWAPASATTTVALGALKPVHVLAPTMCGAVTLDDLGLAVESPWRTIARPNIAPPRADQHKYRAEVTIVAGAMPGAARLAALAAIGAGAGYVALAGDSSRSGPLDTIVHRPPGDLGERGMLLVGPGLGRDEAAWRVLDAAIASPRPLVLDGDALTLLGDQAAHRLRGRGLTVLTPHEGEFTRMFGDGGDKIARTVVAAEASGATIVHKGHTTIVATPDGRVRVSTAGSTWLASAGTGDVLAGAVAACLARGTADPAADAVWLHARASHLAGVAFSADRLAEALPHAMDECR